MRTWNSIARYGAPPETRRSLERLVPKLFAFGIIQHARPTPEKLINIAKQHSQLLDLIPKHDVEATRNLMELFMAKAWMDDIELPDIS